MTILRRRGAAVLLAAALLVAAGCDDSGDEQVVTGGRTATPEATASTGPAPTPSATPSVPGTDSGMDDAEVAEQRDAAASAAAAFVEAVNTYGPTDLDPDGALGAYRDRVGPLLTDDFRTTFEANVGVVEKKVVKDGYERTGRVLARGVASLTVDHAVAVVAGAADSPDGTQVVRAVVGLDLVDGTWLVSDLSVAPDAGPGLTPDPDEEIEPSAAAAREAAVRALPKILGYDYRTLDEHLDEAVAACTEGYGSQLRQTFDNVVRREATQQQAVVTATPIAAGIVSVAPTAVVVLVFLDQEAAKASGTTSYANQVSVTMRLDGDAWLVDGITTA